MELQDHRKLARLMVIQGVTQRELAAAAGWASHTYLGRLVRGQVKTLDSDAAVRIAHHLKVAVDDLFVSRSSTPSGQNVKPRKGAA